MKPAVSYGNLPAYRPPYGTASPYLAALSPYATPAFGKPKAPLPYTAPANRRPSKPHRLASSSALSHPSSSSLKPAASSGGKGGGGAARAMYRFLGPNGEVGPPVPMDATEVDVLSPQGKGQGRWVKMNQ